MVNFNNRLCNWVQDSGFDTQYCFEIVNSHIKRVTKVDQKALNREKKLHIHHSNTDKRQIMDLPFNLQSTLDISNPDISNSAKLEASIIIKYTF